MTDKELKKLSRVELLEILIAQGKENEELKAQLESANKQLESRRLEIAETGSIAEAAIRINGVFDAAQSAAVQYLENIRRMSGEQDELLKAREEASREQCEAMIAETEEACRAKMQETEEACRVQKQEAEEICRVKKQEADAYWNEVSKKLEAFYDAHAGLREMLSINLK